MMDESKDIPQVEEIKFKPKKKKNLRQRIKDEDESDDEELILSKLEEAKEIQKLRERPNGVSVVALATGQATISEEITCKDPFSVKSGGMINMQALKSGKVKQVEDAYDTGIGTQFSAETNKRDEDEEMMKYIEEQLAKRKGRCMVNNSIYYNLFTVQCEPFFILFYYICLVMNKANYLGIKLS